MAIRTDRGQCNEEEKLLYDRLMKRNHQSNLPAGILDLELNQGE